MRQHLENVIAAAVRTRDNGLKLLEGISPERAALKPRFETAGGLVIIDTNHPSFICGHLGLYGARMFTFVGKDPGSVAAPAGWDALYKAGVQCEDDPKGTIYPAWDKVRAQLVSSLNATIEMFGTLDDSVLLRPMPDEKARSFFPTIGLALNFMTTTHVSIHMGQLSAWRRCFGMPAVT